MIAVACAYVLYFTLVVILLTGWKRALQSQNPLAHRTGGRHPLISVIVPVRNEAFNIWNLLTSLEQQEYRNFEVIVVDDHSADETGWVARQFGLANLKVLTNSGSGKKAALATGVRAARGSIIATTDADCLVPARWLSHIREEFHNPALMFVFGPVRIESDGSYFSSLQEIEFSSLIGSGASTAALGLPTFCNGANLAFRKKAYLGVGGYDDNLHIPSGDDEFLMRKIVARYPKGIRFLNNPDALVLTHPQPDMESFLNQRIRWASKWRYNLAWFPRVLAVLVAVLQIFFLVNWAMVLSPRLLPALFLITIKMILEAAFLLQVCRFLGTRWNWLAFFGLQFLYPLYVLVVVTASFITGFRWKDRIFKPREKPPGRQGRGRRIFV